MKTILNTTEKSNFILNMRENTLKRIITAFLIICAICPLLGGAMWLANINLAYVPAGFLSFCGFSAILVFAVAILKKYENLLHNWSYILLGAFVLFACVSSIFPYSFEDALYGHAGRFEGLFAIVSYAGIFLLATLAGKKKHVKTLMDVIVGVGLVQAVIGALQSISALNMNSLFKNLYPVAVEDVWLPSGTSGSPIFLATFLTIAGAIAIAGAAFDKTYARRVVYATASVFFYIISLMTCTLIGYIGIPIAFTVLLVVEFIRIVKCKDIFFSPAISILIVILAAFILSFGIIAMTGEMKILDRGIAFQDGYYNLFTAGQADPYNISNFYTTTWGASIDVMARDWNLLIGTGPDCLHIPQAANGSIVSAMDAMDKSYNHYLYIAVTRGILSLAAYVGLLFISLKKSFGSLNKFFEDSDLWYKCAILTSIIAYSIVIFFGVSTILVAPFFWIMLGLANAKQIQD